MSASSSPEGLRLGPRTSSSDMSCIRMSNSSLLGRSSLFPRGDSISTTPHAILDGSWYIWDNVRKQWTRRTCLMTERAVVTPRGDLPLHTDRGRQCQPYQFFDS